jgi:predicted nucleic acid-binding protein
MRAVLDTSVLISDGATPPDLAGLEGRVSSVSYGELNFGVAISTTEPRRSIRLTRLQRILAVYGPGIPFDDLVAASYGYLYGISHTAGKRSRTRVADLMIAATAHSAGVPLVTRNAVDFDAISGQVQIIVR